MYFTTHQWLRYTELCGQGCWLKHRVDGICPNWQRDTSTLILRLPCKFSISGALWGQLWSIVPSWELAQVATKGLCCLNQWGPHCFLSLYSHQLIHTDLLQGILTLWRGEDPFGSLVRSMDPLSVVFLLMHKIKYIRLWGKLYWNPVIKIF